MGGSNGRLVVGLLLVAGCAAPKPPPSALRPAPQASARADRVPAHIDLRLKLPPRDASGRYITANSNLGPLETMFHFRGALNVAALSCVSARSTAARDGYNAFLRRHKTVLAAANSAVDAKYRRDFGREGLRIRDAKLTSLYNHYAYPSVKPQFCASTAKHLAAANALPSARLEAYSQGALAEIEQHFQDYFAEVARYQARVGAIAASR
jgi:hypothetical protein